MTSKVKISKRPTARGSDLLEAWKTCKGWYGPFRAEFGVRPIIDGNWAVYVSGAEDHLDFTFDDPKQLVDFLEQMIAHVKGKA